MPHATRRETALQNAHESIIAARVKTKVWLELSGEFFVGDGGIHLLGGIISRILASILRAFIPCGALLAREVGLRNRAARDPAFPAVMSIKSPRTRTGRRPAAKSATVPYTSFLFRLQPLCSDRDGDLVFQLGAGLARLGHDQ